MFRNLCALALLSTSLFAQQITVNKIEPPNWYAGLPAPMLLLYGSGFADAHATLTNAPTGVKIANQKAGKDGLYYFIYLSGTDHAHPGPIQIKLTGSAGTQTFTYQLTARPNQPRPQALTGNDVVYLIMPDRFADGDTANDTPANSVAIDRTQARSYHGGDLKGIEKHLDYLKDLGASVLWLTPWLDNNNASAQDYHGYGPVDLYAVDEHFGSLADLRSLSSTARAQGIRLYMDFVPNHVGPLHPWAQHQPEECWLNGTPAHHIANTSRFAPLADPHATAAQRAPITTGWFVNVLPDLDNDCADVEKYWVDFASWWVESAGLDGLRIDTFPYSTRTFWTKWHDDIRRTYPNLSDIGEVIGDDTGDASITAFFQGGRKQYDGIDSQLYTLFDAPMQQAIRDVILNGAPASRFAGVLSHDYLYPHAERLVTYVGNHDMDRFASHTNGDVNRAKLAYGLLATLRGTPEIYYGDEIGMSGGGDPDNRHDFPGGFPSDLHNAFSADGRNADQNALHDYVKAAFALRHAHPALQSGDLREAFVSDSVFAFSRRAQNGSDTLVVILNSSNQPQQVSLSNDASGALPHAASLTEIFAMQPGSAQSLSFTNGSMTVSAPPQSLTVFQVR
jgi:glycosidase